MAYSTVLQPAQSLQKLGCNICQPLQLLSATLQLLPALLQLLSIAKLQHLSALQVPSWLLFGCWLPEQLTAVTWQGMQAFALSIVAAMQHTFRCSKLHCCMLPCMAVLLLILWLILLSLSSA